MEVNQNVDHSKGVTKLQPSQLANSKLLDTSRIVDMDRGLDMTDNIKNDLAGRNAYRATKGEQPRHLSHALGDLLQNGINLGLAGKDYKPTASNVMMRARG